MGKNKNSNILYNLNKYQHVYVIMLSYFCQQYIIFFILIVFLSFFGHVFVITKTI